MIICNLLSVKQMTLEQMIAKAHEGYFVRDAGRNLVICPKGETLRPKSLKRNGDIRYCNKLACRRCKSKCTTSKFKEADFSKDCLIKKVGGMKEDDRRGDNAPQSKLVTEKESGRPVQAPHGREEDGQPQMPFGTSVRNHQADNRRGLLPAAQDVQDRGRDGPVLPCVQHAEGNEYADDGRAGGRDGRMIVRKPRSRARRHCRTDSTRRESRIWKPQLYYDNPPDIAMSGTLKATFQTVWGRV